MIAGAQVLWNNGVKWLPRQFSPNTSSFLKWHTWPNFLRRFGWQIIVIGPSDFIHTKIDKDYNFCKSNQTLA